LLRVFRDYRESVKAYIDNTMNLGLFAVHKIVLEYAERIYAYMDAKRHKTMHVSVNNNTIFEIF